MLLLQQRVVAIRSENQNVRRSTIECRDEQDNDALAVNLPESLVKNIADLEEMLSLIAETSLWSSKENPGGFDTVEAFRDIDDMAMVARRDNKCFAVFRATTAFNPLDVFQLFDWSRKDIGTCMVRGGIYKAYYSCYVDDFVAAVDECMMSGSDTELYLTGHSQGGAIATVASIDLRRHNPMVITFGATRSVLENANCSDINPERHYRFVNTAASNYDRWTMDFGRKGVHVGHTILLDSNANQPAAYVGLNDNTDREPQARSIHKLSFSFPAISKLLEAPSGCSQIRISGWDDGHYCFADDECKGSCIDSRCVVS